MGVQHLKCECEDFSRPSGTCPVFQLFLFPALKRRAILTRPSGAVPRGIARGCPPVLCSSVRN